MWIADFLVWPESDSTLGLLTICELNPTEFLCGTSFFQIIGEIFKSMCVQRR